jgi:LysR family hydrogen peroxide-inducible transcriptional activator
MELHHVRYFLAVSETLNFTRAAETCSVTQPALSRAIQQLEQEVGGPLFRRERNLTHLTDLGQLLRPRFQQIMDTLGKAKLEARQVSRTARPLLTVGIMCTVGPTRFTALLADFGLKFPAVGLRILEGVPEDLTAKLEIGEIDMAVMASATGFPECFDVVPLYRERFVIACPVGHRLAKLDAVPLREVNGENYLLRINCEYRSAIADIIRERGCAINICYRSEREDWIQNMVAGGLGICFIPEFSAILPGLELRPVIEPEISREISIVTLRDRGLTPATTSFIRTVKDYPWPQGRL